MIQRKWTPYVYVDPAVVLLVVFVYIPLIQNIQYRLYSFNPFSLVKRFIGFANYTRLLHDPVFYQAIKNNVWYAIISMIFQVFGGLVIAAILEDKVFRRFSLYQCSFRCLSSVYCLISFTVRRDC